MAEETRRYERIDIELPCRLYIQEDGGALRFQAFTVTRNLGLGGLFVKSTFLVKPGLELYAELTLPSGPLAIRSLVSHGVPLNDRRGPSGLGLEFLGLDARGRETLLRYFTPSRYRTFHDAVLGEFPHLARDLPLPEVSLVLNLWEEWKLRGEMALPPSPASRASRSRR